jgi:TonB family protein
MDTLPLFFEHFGALAWSAFWIPVLLWSLVALLVWLMLNAVGMRLHPAYHHAIRLAVLCALPLGVLLANFAPITAFFSSDAGLMPFVVTLNEAVAIQSLPEITVTGDFEGGAESHPVGSAASTLAFWVGLVQSILLVMAFMLLGRHGLHHVRLMWMRRYGLVPADLHIKDVAGRLIHQAGLNPERIQLSVSHEATVPFTFGWLKPVIVLPERQFEHDKLKSLLAHEIMHVRHNDYLIEWMVQVLRAVCWFHPLVQVYARDVHRYREMLCDAEVISGMIADPRSYASLLLEFAGRNRQPALSVMISMATSESRLKERITAMPNYPKSPEKLAKTRRVSTLVALTVIVFMAFAMALSRTDVSAQSQPETTQMEVVVVTGLQPTSPSVQTFAASDSIRTTAEVMPEPIGGMAAIYNNLRYPESARVDSLQGRVVLQFVVSKQGEVQDPRVVRSIRQDLDAAALKALEGVRFIPGMQGGQPVDVQFVLPIVFRLQPGTPPPPPPPGYAPPSRDPNVPSSHSGENVFIVVEQMPEPIGGMRAIYENLRYPDIARRAGIEGRVVVQFVVDEEGNVVDPFILRAIGAGADEAAIEAIRSVRFNPGVQRGRAVKVVMQMPIVFRLNRDAESDGEPRGSREGLQTTERLFFHTFTEDAEKVLNNPDYAHVRGSIVAADRYLAEDVHITVTSPAGAKGRVRDRENLEPMTGASVLFRHDSSRREFGASTDYSGNFMVTGLLPGTYSVEVTYPGYHRLWFGYTNVKNGELLWADVILGIP